MWYLQSSVDAALRYALVAGKEMTVGRKDCDILIAGEQSISRKHATLFLSEGSPGVVSLTDCKSKFGTSVNGKKLGASQKVELCRDDVIVFGQGSTVTRLSRFKLMFEPLVFCCSAMSKAESAKVKQLARSVGAEVVSNWSERCSHLVMTGITVTVKVVSALSSCKPVVTPAWVEEAAHCHCASLPLPSPASFQPDVVDANIGSGAGGDGVSFAPNYKRTVLFQDRMFYFLAEKQYGRLKTCLLSTGANSQLISSSDSLALETLAKKQSVVVRVDGELMKQATSTQKKWILQVYTFLRCRELRAVLDSEIGFALLHISAEEYCNPRATPSLPTSSSPMAPPTLSQAPATQPHSSQQPSLTHPNTLPYSQDTTRHSYTHDHTTILAPDTLELSQLPTVSDTEKPSTSGTVQKIDETLTTAKGSFDKDASSLENKSVCVKIEDCQKVNQASNTRTVTHIQSVGDKSPLSNSKSPEGTVKHPPPVSNSNGASGASKAAPNSTTTKGEDSRRGQSAVACVKSEPLDSLFGDDDMEECGPPGPLVGVGRHIKVSEERERGEERQITQEVGLGGRDENTEKSSQDLSSSQRSRLKLTLSSQSQRQQPVEEKATAADRVKGRVVYSERSCGANQERANVPPPSKTEAAPVTTSSRVASGTDTKRVAASVEFGNRNSKSVERSGKTSTSEGKCSLSKTSPNNPSLSSSADLPPPSQLEGSIIVPSSLTPRTQEKARKPALPDSQTLAFAFQGKRKKRPHNDASEDALQNQSKKKRVQERGGGEGEGEGEGKVCGVHDRLKGGMEGGDAEMEERGRESAGEVKHGELRTESNKTPQVRSPTGLLSGPNNEGAGTSAGEANEPTPSADVTSSKLPAIMEGLPLLETHEDTTQESHPLRSAGSVKNGTKRFAPEEESMDVDVPLDETGVEMVSTADTSRHPNQNATKTPAHVPPSTPDLSLFLSTRKKHKKSPHDPAVATPTAPTTPGRANASTAWCPFTQYTSSTQQTAAATQRTGVCIATPFTTLVTGGKRSKVNNHDNTAALWDDNGKDRLDGEDPLVDGTNEDGPKKVYKPVCDEDGFVRSRIKPRVQTSRIGRLAAFVDSQHSHNSSENSEEDRGGVGGLQDGVDRSEPLVRITYARLMVTGRGGVKRAGREEGRTDGVLSERRSNSEVKNFKKFRKVMHIGMDAIPRLVSLKEHVPPSSRELQDWMEEQENAVEEEEQERESSQDLFRFATTTTATGRRRR